jgi:hypothetical protein
MRLLLGIATYLLNDALLDGHAIDQPVVDHVPGLLLNSAKQQRSRAIRPGFLCCDGAAQISSVFARSHSEK